MSGCGRTVALIAAVGAISVAVGPPAAADPVPGNQSASETFDQLVAEGYDVRINWVNGSRNGPLSECSVSTIHNPNRSAGPPTTFTTVYIDVTCPDDRFDDLGVGLENPFVPGWGIGF